MDLKRCITLRHNQINRNSGKLRSEARDALDCAVAVAESDQQIAPFDIADRCKRVAECINERREARRRLRS